MFDPHHWNWAVWTIIALNVLGLCGGIAGHGKPETRTKSFHTTFYALLIMNTLYYFAGVFQ